jgi:H+/Cl- antiporter ClcA
MFEWVVFRMALEDLVHVVEGFSKIVPSTGFNLSYYLVLAGLVILAGFLGVFLVSLTVRSLLMLFKKPPSYAIKLILLVGLALFLLGLIMP